MNYSFSLLTKLLRASRNRPQLLPLLNLVLSRVVPFNRGHSFTFLSLDPNATKLLIPLKKRNCNHLGGIHACALATGAELVTGVSLLCQFPPDSYRLILADLAIQYTFQARKNCICTPGVLSEETAQQARAELAESGKTLLCLPVVIIDSEQNRVAEAQIRWQLKAWKAVTTPLGEAS
jgi:acyl-coenzyme A thioesterase PaaI-like protein